MAAALLDTIVAVVIPLAALYVMLKTPLEFQCTLKSTLFKFYIFSD
jgi:hypothetical protein